MVLNPGNRHRGGAARVLAVILIGLLLPLGAGCQQHYGRLTVVSYRDPGRPTTYYQSFPDAWFSQLPSGDYQILLASSEPINSLDRDVLEQTMFIRVFWTPIPGKTFAESSQINAGIDYRIRVADPADAPVVSQRPKTMICYKGSGFVSFSPDPSGRGLKATLEHAVLRPAEESDEPALGRLIVKGQFRARKAEGQIADYRIRAAEACD
ncbi:MAG: hypothetical protein GXY33_19505 [Phycisphaerae bacterium]|nr:hypothetical protein [Phycisphaerae bacterium]